MQTSEEKNEKTLDPILPIDIDAFCVEERGVAAFDLVRWVREKSTTEYVNGEFQYDINSFPPQ